MRLHHLMPLVLICIGCSSNPGTYREFRTRDIQLLCDAIFNCCAFFDSARIRYGDRDSCLSKMNADIETDVAGSESKITQGALRYDPSAASECLASESGLYDSCSRPYDLSLLITPPCLRILSGTVPAGGTCQKNSDCSAGLSCSRGAMGPGMCQPFVPVGGSCTHDGDCEGAGFCAGTTCRNPQEAGQFCVAESNCRSYACDASRNACVAQTVHDIVCR